jgi:hypothetical protein
MAEEANQKKSHVLTDNSQKGHFRPHFYPTKNQAGALQLRACSSFTGISI